MATSKLSPEMLAVCERALPLSARIAFQRATTDAARAAILDRAIPSMVKLAGKPARPGTENVQVSHAMIREDWRKRVAGLAMARDILAS